MYTSQSSSLEQEEHPNELKLLNKYIYNDYILQGLFKHKKKNERDEVAQCWNSIKIFYVQKNLIKNTKHFHLSKL